MSGWVVWLEDQDGWLQDEGWPGVVVPDECDAQHFTEWEKALAVASENGGEVEEAEE